ncbi:asparagine synthase (glutamine-hydrolyzing) [Leptonema illini]|uniref:asparagine synthase (glutamine-hydrolyzing) n=1 Tax=Leptonema illini DSM 21528 TaxID=929563 RepID=H2CK95_9LEPT|nr:asparagine synthase (glutamine-hydrolyzing) [Leptonema illini]EHQ07198.1 asparagine synthase (glutamine-hydrolyzing) [Leptonema illini DSM 21528]
MCGIAGYWNSDGASPDVMTLAGMVAIQRHRGPDGYGWHVDHERGLGMAHTRLAIIDLDERSRQPLLSANGEIAVTVNGELYDFQKIRADLYARGDRFRTKSDSEILLHLYPRYGIEGTLSYLRGEFAFALFDRRSDTLFLARDRFGIKPLYYYADQDRLIFSSEMKGIFAHPDVPRSFSEEGLFHQLMQTQVPGTTPYTGIRQVPPGRFLAVRRKRNGGFHIEQHTYWDADFPLAGEWRFTDEKDAIERVRASLLDAIQARLVADVPVGCYLSGGIDSCSILGLAAACRQDPVKAFTIGFDDAGYDESPIAKRMAASTGADQDIMMLRGEDLYTSFVDTHWHTERTIYNTLGVAKFLMSRHVRDEGYRVVLTGEGSDELFAGYPGFRRDYFLRSDQASGSHHERRLQSSNALFRGAMLSENEIDNSALNALCGFTPSSLQPWLAAGSDVPALLHPTIRASLRGYDPGGAIAETLSADRIRGRHPLDIAQYVWIKTMLEGQILTWGGDRVDMAHSMEARPAFLDHNLAAVAFQIAPDLRIREGREKHVLREAMKGLLPEELYNREKFAFMAPPAHRNEEKSRAFSDLAADFLSDEAIEEAGLLDRQGVRELERRRRHPSGDQAELVRIDALLNHALGVQILRRNLLSSDLPAKAKRLALQKEQTPAAS